MSAFGGAIALPSGELRFRPQNFSFCGHCDNYFMRCVCSDIPFARDYNLKSLPPPPDGSTSEMLLRRWSSCVNTSVSMGSFTALDWCADHGEQKLASIAARADTLVQIIEEYVEKLPTEVSTPLLMKAIGMRSGTTTEGVQRLAREAQSAAAAFIAGDWNCVTRIGALLLNNALQTSDPDTYPLTDEQLGDVFSAIDLLNKVLGMGYSDMGWCLAIENDRAPLVHPAIPSAWERLKEIAEQTNTFSANGACRCGSLTHKRTNHSACPLNPKRTGARR